MQEWVPMTADMREQAGPQQNPFFCRFSAAHGAAGNAEMRRAEIDRMAQSEASDLYNEFANGNLAVQLDAWERAKAAEKDAQKQRKAQKEAEKASRHPRTSRKRKAEGDMTNEEIETYLTYFENEVDRQIRLNQNVITEERRDGSEITEYTFTFTSDTADLAVRDVRALYRLGYIKQDSDLGDNEGVDLRNWLDDATKGYNHFIKPHVKAKMSDEAVQRLIDETAKVLGTSLWFVYKLVIEPGIVGRQAPRRVGARNAPGNRTRSSAARSTIAAAAAASRLMDVDEESRSNSDSGDEEWTSD